MPPTSHIHISDTEPPISPAYQILVESDSLPELVRVLQSSLLELRLLSNS